MVLVHRAVSTLALLCALVRRNEATSSEQSFQGPSRLRRTTAVTVGTITGLRLVDTDTDKPIPGYDPLPLVACIDLNTLSSPNLSLEAFTNGTVKSVSWKTHSFSRIDNFAPWSMCHNSGPDFNPCPYLVAGFNSTITVVPFAVSSTQSGRGTFYSVQLSLYRGSSTKAPVPVVVPTKAPLVAVAPTKAPIVVVAPTKSPVARTKAPTAPIKAPTTKPTLTKVPTVKPVVAPTPKYPTKTPRCCFDEGPGKSAPTRAPVAPTNAPIVVVAPTTALCATTRFPVAQGPAVAPTTKAPVTTPIKAPSKKPTIKPSTNTPASKMAPTTKAPSTVLAVNLTFITLSWFGVGEKSDLLVNNGTVEYKIGRTYTVRAEIVDPSLQSVQFMFDGKVVRVENTAPFVLAGKQGSVLSPWIPTQGRHTLVATSYSQKNASGVVLASTTVSFITRLAKDGGVPLLLKFLPTEKVNSLSPPKSLEISLLARDDESGIARATVFLSSYGSFNDLINHANVTKRFDAASPLRSTCPSHTPAPCHLVPTSITLDWKILLATLVPNSPLHRLQTSD
jgi:hypothetical protein